jgi:hypothetical protein
VGQREWLKKWPGVPEASSGHTRIRGAWGADSDLRVWVGCLARVAVPRGTFWKWAPNWEMFHVEQSRVSPGSGAGL